MGVEQLVYRSETSKDLGVKFVELSSECVLVTMPIDERRLNQEVGYGVPLDLRLRRRSK